MKKRFLRSIVSITVVCGNVLMAGCGKDTPASGESTTQTTTTQTAEATSTTTTQTAETTPTPTPAPAEGNMSATMEGVVVGKFYQYLSEAAKYEGLTNVGFEGLNTEELEAWLMEQAPDYVAGIDPENQYFALDLFLTGNICSVNEGFKFISGDGMGWTPELHNEKVANGEWREYSLFSEWEETGKFHYGE